VEAGAHRKREISSFMISFVPPKILDTRASAYRRDPRAQRPVQVIARGVQGTFD
jgi:hypothetical protein